MKTVLTIFFSVKPLHAFLVLACLLVANLVEGLGLATLLPVITLASGQQSSDSMAQTIVVDFLDTIGLDASLGYLLTLVVAALVIKSVIRFFALSLVGFTAADVTNNLRQRIIENLLNVRWRYLVHQPMGRITNVVSNDATRSRAAYNQAANFLAMIGETIVLSLVAIIISWKLSLVAFAMGVIMMLALHVLVRIARRAGYAQTLRTKELIVFLSDTLANLKLIRAMDKQAPFGKLLALKVRKVRNTLRREVISQEAISSIQDAGMALFLGAGFYVLFNHFHVPLAELLVSGIVVSKLTGSLGKLQKAYQRVVVVESAFLSARDLIDETAADPEPKRGQIAPDFQKYCQFRNLSFAYDEDVILNGIDLEIRKGELTVLTGPSGAGKSTLVDLLFGLYRPSGGDLLIDDVPIKDIDTYRWRSQLGYVPQDVTLLHDTIKANLTLGDETITETAIWEALEAAGIADVVRQSPDELDTIVGERGTRFSGGQRQRLALARALTPNPKLLVLDEVTSALDHETAQRVASEVRRLIPKMTVLAVTHRPEFLDSADAIYHIEGGKARRQEVITQNL